MFKKNKNKKLIQGPVKKKNKKNKKGKTTKDPQTMGSFSSSCLFLGTFTITNSNS